MKEHLHIKHIEIPLYRGYFIIIVTNSSDRVKKHIPIFPYDEVYAHSFSGNYRGRQGFMMVLNFKNGFRKIKHGVITHEAIHIAHFIADNRGIQANFNNDEPITYLAEWITDETYKFINKLNYKPE